MKFQIYGYKTKGQWCMFCPKIGLVDYGKRKYVLADNMKCMLTEYVDVCINNNLPADQLNKSVSWVHHFNYILRGGYKCEVDITLKK